MRERDTEARIALRPLTWAVAEAACRCVTSASGRPLTPFDAPGAEGATVADARGLVSAVCDEGSELAGQPLAALPADVLAVVAPQVWAAVADEIGAAMREAARVRSYRAALLPEPYRTVFVDRVTPPPEPPGEGETPHPTRTLAVALAGDGPAAWAITEEWPLARLLRFVEDAAVAAVLADIHRSIEEVTRG